jgi:NitT/TauT family transport system substrate-binding protein
VLRLVEEGTGRILVRFGDRIPDFHVHVVFARKAFLESRPDAARNFLAALFESVQYMREHRDETIDIAMRVAGVSKSVAAANYDELMPVFNKSGRFDAKALDVLARSFVEMGALSERPDMSKLYTEAFLPKN